MGVGALTIQMQQHWVYVMGIMIEKVGLATTTPRQTCLELHRVVVVVS